MLLAFLYVSSHPSYFFLWSSWNFDSYFMGTKNNLNMEYDIAESD
ncbi:MAG: hypothetical protein ACI83B_000222 [Sediminicola sp.]|jgi:hypothetical protein